MLILWAVVLIGLLIFTATGCHTAEAIENLPEGYWVSTERLVVALLEDLWAIIDFLL